MLLAVAPWKTKHWISQCEEQPSFSINAHTAGSEVWRERQEVQKMKTFTSCCTVNNRRQNDETSATNPISTESPNIGLCADITRVCSDFQTARERVKRKTNVCLRQGRQEDEKTAASSWKNIYTYLYIKYIHIHMYTYICLHRNMVSAWFLNHIIFLYAHVFIGEKSWATLRSMYRQKEMGHLGCFKTKIYKSTLLWFRAVIAKV